MLFVITLMVLAADPNSNVETTSSPTTGVASPTRSASKLEGVHGLELRLEAWKKKYGNDEDDGEWVVDRARLEMQLATSRLEYSAALLDEACKQSDPQVRRRSVLESLRKVQEVDRTLDIVNIERLDDYDRRAYRGLSAMRHRVSSMQIYTLLKITGDTPSTSAEVPEIPKHLLGGANVQVPSPPCARGCRPLVHLFSRR